MAKKRFKIPTSLDVSYLDMEFNLKSKNGVGLSKPVTAKVIVSTLFAAFAWFFILTKTFIGQGGIGIAIGFTLAWGVLAFLFIKADKTQRMGAELAVSAINYLPKSGRHVPVRMNDPVHRLQQLSHIREVDPEDGLIHYMDGYIGKGYHVVGSASALMFEQDQQRILDKVDMFYRKVAVGSEMIYDTLYEAQNVDDQIEHVRKEKENLSVPSQGLRHLLNEKHAILEHVISSAEGLTSLHQYLVVRVPNEAALVEFENLVLSDVENEGLMFRLVRQLSYREVERYFGSIMRPMHISQAAEKGD